MRVGIIGIKIANGEFYPILKEGFPVRKRLVLTTVHDNQLGMQIDLFKSAKGKMTDAEYIGSLVIDQLNPKTKGEPSVELIVSIDEESNIEANAVDLDEEAGGERYVLNVSLKSLDVSISDSDFLDFELDILEEQPPLGLYGNANKRRKGGKLRKGSLKLTLIITVFIVLLLLAGVWLFFLGGLEMFFPDTVLSEMRNRLMEKLSLPAIFPPRN